MTDKLTQALEDQKQQTEQFNQKIAGILGIPLGGQRRVEVSGRNAYVYVRLRSNQSEVIQAYNNTVATSYNLPVLVERQGNRYVVVSVDTQRYDNNWNSNAAFLPRHGNSHSFDIESGGGGDIVWVQPRQITPILVMPSGSSGADNVIINPYTLMYNSGVFKYVGNTGTASLAPYRPVSPTGAVMALVYLDVDSGNPYFLINSGTVFSNTITGSSQVAQFIPNVVAPQSQIPLAAIRLITGTNIISWDNIYDVRQFLQVSPSGSSGGALSSIPVQDEGVSVGSATTFNFVGDGVQATISGSVARIDVSGGSINTGTLDARYLKLDTSNDPLTGPLTITPTGVAGGYNGLTTIQNVSVVTGTTNSPAISVVRTADGAGPANLVTYDGDAAYGVRISDVHPYARYIGGALFHADNIGVKRTDLNAYAPSGIAYVLDTSRLLTGTNKILSVRNFGEEKFSVGQSGSVNIPVGQTYNINGSPHTHASDAYPPLFFVGLQMSNNGSDANNDIDLSTGSCRDSGNSENIDVSSMITKRLDAAWAVGTNQGGLFSGTKSANTWYHFFAIKRTDTGVVDAGFDTSIVAANRPASYDKYRLIGSVLTSAGNNIIGFYNVKNKFYWNSPTRDITTTSGTPATAVVKVPTGRKVQVFGTAAVVAGGSASYAFVYDPDVSYSNVSEYAVTAYANAGQTGMSSYSVTSNNSGQLGYDLQSPGTFVWDTAGWEELRTM